MSTPSARAAINTHLAYGDGGCPEVFTVLANVGSITSSMSLTVQDVTSHSTDVPWRQKFPTLLDGGDLSFDLFFVPDDPNHKTALGFFLNRDIKDWKMTFPNSSGANFTFQGFFSKFGAGEKVDDVIRVPVTLTVTGPVYANY